MTSHRISPCWVSQSRQWRPLPTDWRERFLATLAHERTIYGAAKRIGIGRGSVYYARNTDPDFAARLAAVLAGTTTSRKAD